MPIMCLAFVLIAYNFLTACQTSYEDMNDVQDQFFLLLHIACILIARHKSGHDLRKQHLPRKFLYGQPIDVDTIHLWA